ncbi:galactokinase [Iamia sp. SCSIO 61187]|uniref:galactokinase n=1 Tax=Iamia sp. SCSIO 61187 TaxID=2722752 RepID=UPI001C635DD8|nr:galactokinase [Iamia sp. SCSIO 61187]QYG92624.1 galactokinase [Iamia sp. SCSIO 61187]
MAGDHVRVRAPGRVNLIGDHTDHTGGLVLPAAIDLETVVEGQRGGAEVVLRSDGDPEVAVVPLAVADPAEVAPGWARYVAGVVVEARPPEGFTGTVTTTLPLGGGLSSSAALEVALVLSLRPDLGDALSVARLGQRAEHRATGVPCGIMDQLASAGGRAGHALLIDCHTLAVEPVPLPDDLDVVVVDSGQARRLEGSPYAERAAQCRAAEAVIGPLREAPPGTEVAIADPVVRARARHVLGENARVRAAATALRGRDHALLGALLRESHASLRDDFAVSTPTLDALVGRLAAAPGVWGARLTGAGFGGCVVAVAERGALDEWGPETWWRVRPSDGATVEVR